MSLRYRLRGYSPMTAAFGQRQALASRNCRLARELWKDALGRWHLRTLKDLTTSFQFSLLLGDLSLLQGKWYVTHTGLIRLARRNRCAGIRVEMVDQFCDATAGGRAFKTTVFKSCRGPRLPCFRAAGSSHCPGP